MKMIFLVDGDNNIGTGLKGMEMLSEQDTVMIFYQKGGLSPSRIQKLCGQSKARIQLIESIRGGKNAVDFQIITELGVLIGQREADYAYVISQDKGYAASIDALRARYAEAFQEVSLRPSIEDCLSLPFVLRAQDRHALCNALVKEYGEAQGLGLYNHLKQLFQGLERGRSQGRRDQTERIEAERKEQSEREGKARSEREGKERSEREKKERSEREKKERSEREKKERSEREKPLKITLPHRNRGRSRGR